MPPIHTGDAVIYTDEREGDMLGFVLAIRKDEQTADLMVMWDSGERHWFDGRYRPVMRAVGMYTTPRSDEPQPGHWRPVPQKRRRA
jgi:hypothetical protein